jgi:sugar fermentation stimulation protein A
VKPEYKISKETRLDLMLSHSKSQKQHFVEVKNVTLKSEDNWAEFPDAVTERGQKHLKELMSLKEQGHSAEILFIIQRNDITKFRPAESIDPEYASLLRKASEVGVKITAVVAEIEANNTLKLTRQIPIHL